jgi:hypothetical protein
MASFQKKYPVTSTAEMMYAIYQFIADPSQTVVDFVVDNGETAIWADSTETGASPDQYVTSVSSAEAFEAAGCFMVVEVTFNNPGGRRWQAKIYKSTSTLLNIEGSPTGGWTIVSATSGGSDSFGAAPTTGTRPWYGSPTLAQGDEIYLSSNDGDTYNGGADKYGYFMGLLFDSSSWAPGVYSFVRGFYTGGYIPFDVTNDTDPYLVLAGFPSLGNASDYWGTLSTGSANENRVPIENGLATTSMVSNGYASLGSNVEIFFSSYAHQTRSGIPIHAYITVHDIGNNRCLGYLGEQTMVQIGFKVDNREANADKNRIAIGDIAIYWEE